MSAHRNFFQNSPTENRLLFIMSVILLETKLSPVPIVTNPSKFDNRKYSGMLATVLKNCPPKFDHILTRLYHISYEKVFSQTARKPLGSSQSEKGTIYLPKNYR